MAEGIHTTKVTTQGDKAYISLGGQNVELRGWPTANTYTWTTTTQTELLSGSVEAYTKQVGELTETVRKAAGALRKLAEKLEDQPPTVLVDIFNRIGDTVYGSTWHSKGVKVGDKVVLEDKHTGVAMDGVVEFIEGESIGYRIND